MTMKLEFLSDEILISAFLISLTVITWIEVIAHWLEIPKLVEWSWVFVLLFSFSGATALFYLFQKKGR